MGFLDFRENEDIIWIVVVIVVLFLLFSDRD